MKEIKFTLIFFLMLLIPTLIITSCSKQPTQDYQENKNQAIEFLQSSDEFQLSQGFDIIEPEQGVNSCGIDCFEFNFQYSTLGNTIGYKTTIVVQNGNPKFKSTPQALN